MEKVSPWVNKYGRPTTAIFFAVVTWLASGNPFFWDNIMLASKCAQWYYTHGVGDGILPSEIDTGHPPLFGIYLAAAWKTFGQTLAVSHWAMYPFIVGTAWQALRLANRVAPQWPILATVFILADASLLAQSTQISPDVPLLFFAFFAVNNILQQNAPSAPATTFDWQKSLMLTGLAFVSTRGIVLCMALFLAEIALLGWRGQLKQNFLKTALKTVLPYLPAGLLMLSWLVWHYQHTGWIGYNIHSQWRDNYQNTDLFGFVRNIVVLAWRLTDIGRVAVWILLTVGLWNTYQQRKNLSPIVTHCLIIAAVLLGVMSAFFLPYQNPIGHRYVTIVMVLLMAAAVGLLSQVLPNQRKLFLSFCGGGLLLALSGHFWITPETMAKGWDSMLSHIWYFDYRDDAVRYLKTQNIAEGTVGSDFPNLATHQQITLENGSYYFVQKNVAEQTYILQSNAMNGFSETELTQLHDTTRWTLEKSWGDWPVYVHLYRRKI